MDIAEFQRTVGCEIVGCAKCEYDFQTRCGEARQTKPWYEVPQIGRWSVAAEPGTIPASFGIDYSADYLAEVRSEAARAERTRILAALEAIKPMEQPYTRRDWAIEQKGEKAMFAKVMKAIGGVA